HRTHGRLSRPGRRHGADAPRTGTRCRAPSAVRTPRSGTTVRAAATPSRPDSVMPRVSKRVKGSSIMPARSERSPVAQAESATPRRTAKRRRSLSASARSAPGIGDGIVAPLEARVRGMVPAPGWELPGGSGGHQVKMLTVLRQRHPIAISPGPCRPARLTRPGAGRTFRISVYRTEIREELGGRGGPPLARGGWNLRMLVLGAGLQGSACAYDLLQNA